MVDLNLTSNEFRSTNNQTFNEYFRDFLKIADNETFSLAIARILDISDENSLVIKNLESLDFLSKERIPENIGQSPLEILRYICFQKLKNCRNEKDLSLLKHTFEVEYANDGWRETIEVVLVDVGLQTNEFSSMARTISLPLAITVRAFLEGRINTRGVVRPLQPEFYEEILNEMKKLNIRFEEKTLPPLIWMRDEIKPGERRCPITPINCLKLIQAGFQITVECSDNRCIADEEFERVGCTMVESQSWITQAPYSAFILGIKELSADEPQIIRHRHIYFAHCFKGQSEAVPLLKRFAAGNGEILDLEYLVNENGRRVAAFGRPAGMVGMAIAIIAWCKQVLNESFDEIHPFENERSMVKYCRQLLKKSVPLSIRGKMPAVMIMGALGRCGKGCTHIAKLVGVTEITAWDIKETRSAGPGPYPTIVNDHEIFVNCIKLQQKIVPFLTLEMCGGKSRRLSVISDVACDASNVNNPVAVYDEITNMVHPVRRIHVNGNAKVLDVTAIDHLPTLIPLESSEQYSDDLFDTLMDLKNRESAIWQRARGTFYEHVNSYKQIIA